MLQLLKLTKTLQLKKNAMAQEFSVWSLKFMAITRKEGFVKIMTGAENVPAAGDANYDAKKKHNDDGYRYLLLTVANEKDAVTVLESAEAELSEGSIKLTWENLSKNHKP